MKNDSDELLDVIEFCEGALMDHFASSIGVDTSCHKEGLEFKTALRIAHMCSDVLVKHGRTSVIVESRKTPET